MAWTQIGTTTTDDNGIATFTYTGTGAGEVNFKVSNDDGSLVSETHNVIDALYYDDATTDNKSNYRYNSEMTVTHSNSKYTVQCGANYRRLNFYAGSDMLELLKGKTIKFRCSIETSINVQLILYVNNTSATSTANTSVDATLETSSYTIPSDATGVRFEIVGTVSQAFSFKDFLIYISN